MEIKKDAGAGNIFAIKGIRNYQCLQLNKKNT